MTREAVISILRAHEASLRRRGVRRAALFGSTARSDSKADSDIDILVEIDPSAHVDL
jgi:predicted nucleotidyltransferase